MPVARPLSAIPRVLLIGWDSAEWKVIRPLAERGLLPNLTRLMGRGECAHLAGGDPLLSPTRWATILTGRHPTRHGLLASAEIGAAGQHFRAIGRAALQSPPIWTMLDRAGIACHAIHFPATHPAEPLRGVSISNHFAEDSTNSETVRPRQHAELLSQFRVKAAQIDLATLRTFVPSATDEERRRDPRLRQIAAIVAHSATVHAAATWAIERVAWQFAAICYTGLHQFSHGFMPFHPPQMPTIRKDDFDRFHGVIAAAYQFHDMMLGRLIELAGPETRVVLVSDHGFQCDHLRPAPAVISEQAMLAWHRPSGVSVIAGPGIATSDGCRQRNVLDIVPMILGWFGLTLDDVPPHPAPVENPREQLEDESVAYLKQLGYAEPEDAYAVHEARRLANRRQFYLAVAWLDARRPERAAPLLEQLLQGNPGDVEYRIALGHAYADARRISDCRRLVDEFLREYPRSATALAAAGLLEVEARRAELAIAYLVKAQELGLRSAALYAGVGRAYLRLRKYTDACRAFSRAVELDPECAPAQEGLGLALLGEGAPVVAAEACERAIALAPDDAMLHYSYARVLAELGRWTDARSALQAAVAIDPQCVPALHKLGEICDRLGDLTAAREFDRQAHLASARRRMASFQASYTVPPSP